MKFAIRTLAALLALSSTAVAEDWTTVSPAPNSLDLPKTFPIIVPQVAYNADRLYNGLSVFVTCSFGTPPELCGTPGDPVYQVGRLVPLPEFARSSTVTALSAQIASVSSAVGTMSNRITALETGITSLATSSSVSALSARVSGAEAQLVAIQNSVAGFEAFIPEALESTRRQADEGSAMAAAMTTVAPADGKANRIGFNTATYNGSTAVAVSYSRAAGDVDFNVGVAMAGENAMVKAGAGFSW